MLYLVYKCACFVFATYCRPGMNSCKITEDETTRALRALYMVPAPENSIKDGGHDNAMSGIGAPIAPTFQGNKQSISSLGKLKGSHDGANVANTLDSAGMSKPSKKLHAPSSRNFPKPKEKRKLVESSDKGAPPIVLLKFTNTFPLF
jgi:hypothetical protein